jgi:hypothetical protein
LLPQNRRLEDYDFALQPNLDHDLLDFLY